LEIPQILVARIGSIAWFYSLWGRFFSSLVSDLLLAAGKVNSECPHHIHSRQACPMDSLSIHSSLGMGSLNTHSSSLGMDNPNIHSSSQGMGSLNTHSSSLGMDSLRTIRGNRALIKILPGTIYRYKSM
jgi:hypothetical protein